MYIKIYLVLVMTMTLVLGDIGGTNARLAYSKSAYDRLKNPKIFNCKDFVRIEDLLETELLFICVPSPAKEDNSCDISNVESCIKDLKQLNYKCVICIKSTVEPGSTSMLSSKYNLDLCFVPEFGVYCLEFNFCDFSQLRFGRI